MKSDSTAIPFPTGPAADAFRAFFETCDGPAALCDSNLTVLTANQAFEQLCGTRDLTGQSLQDVLEHAPGVPGEGQTQVVEVGLKSGQSVRLTFSRRGGTVAVVGRQLPAHDSLTAAGRALLEHGRVEQALLELGRQVAGAMSEEELVAAVARGVKGLFPGRTFCVRITDPRSCALTSLYAEGRMKDGVRDTIVLKKSAAEKTNLNTQVLPKDRVKLSSERPLLFHGSVRGICAPLVASGQLFGAIDVEYPEGMSADLVSDDRVLIQLANQVSVAVRNAKLIDELLFVRKYLEELLEHANALIIVVNRDRKVVVFNQLVSQLTGLDRHEVLGKDLLDIVPEADRLKTLRAMQQSLRGEQVTGFETALIGKQGAQVRASFATSSVLTQSGEVEGVISIGHDMTRMRSLEQQVIHAEKLASLGQLAASVVHEINNPMTAVATYADALLKRSLGQPNADHADVEKYRKIVDNSERVLRFTRDLVSYTRPAHDKPVTVDLNQVVEQAIGFCEHVIGKHGLQLDRQLEQVPAFLAVRGNLVQVLVNLITNACHATPPGGTITVGTHLDGASAQVWVRDTGSGIPEAVRPRIFEPFFTTKPDGKGTGLGLSIVQGIVEHHGGSISVESDPSGTRFLIRLPMVS